MFKVDRLEKGKTVAPTGRARVFVLNATAAFSCLRCRVYDIMKSRMPVSF
jgi:hypothetical protein